MPLSYTDDQLTREAQLLATELALLADLVVGVDAGPRTLGLDDDSPFAQSRHPDDLSEIHGMAVSQHITRVERYVREHHWDDAIANDVLILSSAVERIFSPAVLAGYEVERLDHPDEVAIPKPFEEGAGDVPFGFFHHGILASLVALAAARLKIDQGERLTLAEVALLLDVREATVITNAHRKNFPTVEDDNRRYAEPSDVLPWMVKQGYLPTRMPVQGEAETPPSGASADEEAVVFVPVARDGSWFGPDCSSGGRYTIGAKGDEVKFTDYFAALDALLKMPTPRWRRQNGNGTPGIVAGVRFDRVRRSDIQRALR